MKAVIFNSGLGKRMGKLTEQTHKAMVLLNNDETIYERQVRILSECGINEFIVTTGPFKEQIEDVAKQERFKDLKFTFVENPIYDETNYIYSMYLAKDHIDGDVLLLHGDLVFNKQLVIDILNNEDESFGLINKLKELPEEDFKARVNNGYIKEIGVNIFDEDCYAFQPFYKLSKRHIKEWLKEVSNFIEQKNDKVYAENALNNILGDVKIKTFSYENHYIDEVDTADDLKRVSEDIRNFDFNEQEVYFGDDSYLKLKEIFEKNKVKKPFIVSTNSLRSHEIVEYIKEMYSDAVLFSDFKPNPLYEDILKGVNIFNEEQCDFIVSLGGGSAIDVAKVIKLYSPHPKGTDYINAESKYSHFKHVSIPSTSGTGSESTRFAVMYYKGEKQSVVHDTIFPEYTILEPKLLETLPDYHKKSTMLDALCQAIESHWSINSTTESKEYAKKSINMILDNMESYLNNEKIGLTNMMVASNYAGRSINITQTTAAHAMSYKITSLYNVSHGHAVAIVLPYIWRYMIENTDKYVDKRGESYLKETFKELNSLFKVNDSNKAVDKFEELYNSLNLDKPKLKNDEELNELVSSVNQTRLANNPVKLSDDTITKIYRKTME